MAGTGKTTGSPFPSFFSAAPDAPKRDLLTQAILRHELQKRTSLREVRLVSVVFISSIPPLDLGEGEGGGRTKMRNKRQVQDVLDNFLRCLWSFPRCLWSGEKNINVRKGTPCLGFLCLWSGGKNEFQG